MLVTGTSFYGYASQSLKNARSHSTNAQSSNPSSSVQDGASSSYVFTLQSDEDLASDKLFQNLLKNQTVQQHVTLNDDGTYSFNWSKDEGFVEDHSDGLKLRLARDLIKGQGVQPYGNNDIPNGEEKTNGEIALFKQLTGYNLVVDSRGSEYIVDDFGREPPAGDRDMVKEAKGVVEDVTAARYLGLIDGDLTSDNASVILSMMGLSISEHDGKTGNRMVDRLLQLLGEQDKAKAEKDASDKGIDDSAQTASVISETTSTVETN